MIQIGVTGHQEIPAAAYVFIRGRLEHSLRTKAISYWVSRLWQQG
jgi:hypothetical protein